VNPFPVPLRAIHQIEITSRCNLVCPYCPSRDIQAGKYPNRPALDMTLPIYLRALEWAAYCVRRHGQRELNLAGIGESTLHPDFVSFVLAARRAVGPDVRLVYATNGIPPKGADLAAIIRSIAPARPQVWVSLHRPEKAEAAVRLYREAGLLVGLSVDPAANPNDWAGQVQWPVAGQSRDLPCQWLRDGKAFVLADGRLSTCCLDAQGIGVIGHVDDAIGPLDLAPYALCRACYQTIEAPAWDQRRGQPREPVPA
jgi:hypothetical protein